MSRRSTRIGAGNSKLISTLSEAEPIGEQKGVSVSSSQVPVQSRRYRCAAVGQCWLSLSPPGQWGVSVEGRVHGGYEQGRQLSDVIQSIDAEDGFFDGGLALGRDDAVGQLGVLVTDVRVG
jgi:hypothetical protein